MRTYIKKDVVERVAVLSNERPDTVAKVVNDTFTVLRQIMAGDEAELRIEIRDFGVFEVKKTKPKPKARNPKTNEIIYVAARRKTHFKPGKLLKESLKTPLDQIPPSEQ
ncbi:MAG: integration host factor subunit beta [Calditrichaeota bacterium]|nr:integration host factor subunit beta [Calditrichota bacterium]MCB9367815.1 integration host factor subunit beta [Calditrichota bacterium]